MPRDLTEQTAMSGRLSRDSYAWYPVEMPADRLQIHGYEDSDSLKECVGEIVLKQMGFACFVPRESRWRFPNQVARRRGTKRLRRSQLFPGVAFAGVKFGDDWRRLYRVSLVRSVITTSRGTMVPVNGERLHGIMDRYSRGAFRAPDHHKYMETGHEFDPGDEVVMISGPLVGQHFRVGKIHGREADILCRLLGREQVHRVGVENMRKVA